MSFLSRRKTIKKIQRTISTQNPEHQETIEVTRELFYAITSHWDKTTKTREKHQVYIGRHCSLLGYKFNYKAVFWNYLFTGTELEEEYNKFIEIHPQLLEEYEKHKDEFTNIIRNKTEKILTQQNNA